MKRGAHIVYTVVLILSMVLGGISYVQAETPMHHTRQMEGARREGTETKNVSLTEAQQDRFINLVRNVFSRMEGAVLRLENIANRLDTRINTLETSGVDVTLARTPLNDARGKLNGIKTQLETAKVTAEKGILSDSPRERFSETREQFRVIRTSIRDIYVLLRGSLAELKDAVMESEVNKKGAATAQNQEERTLITQ